MHIQSTTTPKYKSTFHPTFGAIPICNGKVFKPLQDGTKELIPVEISVLQVKDKKLIKEIQEEWEATKYGTRFIFEYLKKIISGTKNIEPNKRAINYLMLNLKTNEPTSTKPLCFAKISRWNKLMSIDILQANNDVIYPNKNRLSGCGEMMMYAILKFAKSIDSPSLGFVPANDGFYSKILKTRITKANDSVELNKRDINRFLLRTQRKYNMLDDTEILSQKELYAVNKNCFPSE